MPRSKKRLILAGCPATVPLIRRDGTVEDYPTNKRRRSTSATPSSSSSSSTSLYKGVYKESRSGRWYAQISVHQGMYYLGAFDAEQDAALEYSKAVWKYRKQQQQVKASSSSPTATKSVSSSSSKQAEMYGGMDLSDIPDHLPLIASTAHEGQYAGVTERRDRFQAMIYRDGKNRYLGTFDTAEQAAQIYARAAAYLQQQKQEHGKKVQEEDEPLVDILSKTSGAASKRSSTDKNKKGSSSSSSNKYNNKRKRLVMEEQEESDEEEHKSPKSKTNEDESDSDEEKPVAKRTSKKRGTKNERDGEGDDDEIDEKASASAKNKSKKKSSVFAAEAAAKAAARERAKSKEPEIYGGIDISGIPVDLDLLPSERGSGRYKGITKKSDRWQAKIQAPDKWRVLGTFDTQAEAGLLYTRCAYFFKQNPTWNSKPSKVKASSSSNNKKNKSAEVKPSSADTKPAGKRNSTNRQDSSHKNGVEQSHETERKNSQDEEEEPWPGSGYTDLPDLIII